MEYVPGLPINEYCDQKKLKIADRLELFIQACDGVQHAHQKAIIHRDLKPANILVVEVDGRPTARIIDFGLAKANAPQVEGETLFTHLGSMVGTPGFMSPEQADPNVRDIDTRTDVYSLGVVLYVLLAGLQPFENRQRNKEPLDEVLRKLREEEPPRPSSKVSTDRVTSAATAEARGTEPRQLVKMLRGDLDWITMRALEKDRARRYGTPSELAADIQRYLAHKPVVARPASVGYQARKYVRRHRVAVAAASALVLLLAAFSALQAAQLRRITRERDRANRERDRAARITDFMTGMFKVSDPNEARGNSVTAREILDKASHDMGAGLARDPEVQSQLMQVMARTYTNLGLYDRAYELAKPALDLRLRTLGPGDPKTLDSRTLLGWILCRKGQYAEAEKMERAALADERRILGPEDPLTLETIDHLAVTVEDLGHFDEEEKLEREVIEVASRRLGPENPQTLRAMNNLGTALWSQGRYADAEQEYRAVLGIERRVWGPDHPETLIAMGNLALSIQSQGRMAEAEQLYRDAFAATGRVLGAEHPATIRATENLATVLCDEGRLAECEKLHRETLAIQTRTLGPEHADTLLSKLNLADALLRQGHLREAEKLQRETLETQFHALGPKNPDTLLSESDLARTLIREGRYVEAEKMARDAFEVQVQGLGPQHPDTINTLQLLGMALALNHRYPEAATLFHEVIAREGNVQGQGNRWSAWYSFACVAAVANHSGEAVRYLEQAIQRGYDDADGLMTDGDLKNIRRNPRFQELVVALKRASAKAQ
jgi:non-specific serine/threonine protein kinase/serine/threonine-protein kinase